MNSALFCLVSGGDLGTAITSLNDKACRAKNQGEVRNLSLDQVDGEFDGFIEQLVE
ncbi:hypothetical protein [Vibrio sp. GLN_1]|uniref:hypothetical protein n=1 Tax=Vibrio sp. GLN_1 TaxID=3367179 RepID=UPI00370BE6FC